MKRAIVVALACVLPGGPYGVALLASALGALVGRSPPIPPEGRNPRA